MNYVQEYYRTLADFHDRMEKTYSLAAKDNYSLNRTEIIIDAIVTDAIIQLAEIKVKHSKSGATIVKGFII